MNQPAPTTLAELREIQLFAGLTLDGYRWLLPQTEIYSLESLLDIDQEVRTSHSIGAVGFRGEWWPVYCLSGEMQLLPHIPDSRRNCVLLDNHADRLGLICDHVETIAADQHLLELPACMRLPGSPLQALALLNGRLGCVTTTEHLAALLAVHAETPHGC
ncbi:MAG: hypothetical protein KDJ34_11465 [Candidatus Competibacteraceae bacterium]|nr:hypothetical protein [Candidatus Competibacteraceae bacterium]MCP5132648.1 hypothetical protein [Gammaproteobacteria bacterium]